MKYRQQNKANGYLDSLVIRAEQLASYVIRKNKPPHVTLERIANLADKAINYQHTRVHHRSGKVVSDNRANRQEKQEKQRKKCLARIWDAYLLVQEREIMHKNSKGKDESWNGAKQDPVTKLYVSEPIYYYGDHFEYVMGDELHGNKAKGVTPIRDSNYNGEKKGEDE
tara:strand:- start:91 stop:594 length:504 start_codon:yes stop_codon:yes gene_type:complete